MNAEKIMADMMGQVGTTRPAAVSDRELQTAVENLAQMVVMYNAELKRQGVGYFCRRSLLIAFQTQTLGTALLMNS